MFFAFEVKQKILGIIFANPSCFIFLSSMSAFLFPRLTVWVLFSLIILFLIPNA